MKQFVLKTEGFQVGPSFSHMTQDKLLHFSKVRFLFSQSKRIIIVLTSYDGSKKY